SDARQTAGARIRRRLEEIFPALTRELNLSMPVGRQKQHRNARVLDQFDRHVPRQKTGENVLPCQTKYDQRDLLLGGGVEDGAGDVIGEHEQSLNRDVLRGELVAEQTYRRLAVGLLLLAH